MTEEPNSLIPVLTRYGSETASMEIKDHISKQDRKWNEMFERLQEYAISNNMRPVSGKLGKWYSEQKYKLRDGTLREARKIKFESIKFEVNYQLKGWLIKYDQLLKFRESSPDHWPAYNKAEPGSPENKLVIFCQLIRKRYKDNRLEEYWIHRFSEIGFNFERYQDNWYNRYQKIKEIIADKKSISSKEIGGNNYEWIYLNKTYYDKGLRLSPRQRDLIRELDLKRFYPSWDDKFNRVCSFLKKRKKFPTHLSNPELWSWLHSQRHRYHVGRLSDEKTEKLRDIGLNLVKTVKDKNNLRWNEQFRKLKAFRNLYPDRWPGNKGEKDENELFNWCNAQRQAQAGTHSGGRRKLLEEWRVKELDSLGFRWSRKDLYRTAWDINYEKIRTFIMSNKTSKIPANIEEKRNPLYSWLTWQKVNYRKGNYDNEKYLKLKMIGIDISK
jgi:hypothetical protein